VSVEWGAFAAGEAACSAALKWIGRRLLVDGRWLRGGGKLQVAAANRQPPILRIKTSKRCGSLVVAGCCTTQAVAIKLKILKLKHVECKRCQGECIISRVLASERGVGVERKPQVTVKGGYRN